MSHTHISASLRRKVFEKAGGRCEYCRLPERFSFAVHQIDHVIPEKHGGETVEDNLALSCILCNKYKCSDLASIDPKTGKITPLYNPRTQQWPLHFSLNEDGFLVSETAEGRATIRTLQLNRAERIEERRLMKGAGFWDL